MFKAEKVVLAVAPLIALYCVGCVGHIQYRLSSNSLVRDQLRPALQLRYKGISLSEGIWFEKVFVHITVQNVIDPATQAEMRDWRSARKANRQIVERVQQKFPDAKGEKVAVFDV